MGKIIKSVYRYPLFFIGVMTIVVSAFSLRYLHIPSWTAGLFALIGFLIFLLSLSPF